MNNNAVAYRCLVQRGVTRLCHFTKLAGLVHILTSDDGILATEFIGADVKRQNDMKRYDHTLDHVCCSIQYPNGWYWKRARDQDEDCIFKEWAIIMISLDILKEREFRFCCLNAATGHGAYIRKDVENISAVFDNPSLKGRTRPALMLNCCPTDDQAEILIYKNIPTRYIIGIIVGDEECANMVGAILKTAAKFIPTPIPVYVSPDVCNNSWSAQIRRGEIPQETEYNYQGE